MLQTRHVKCASGLAKHSTFNYQVSKRECFLNELIGQNLKLKFRLCTPKAPSLVSLFLIF